MDVLDPEYITDLYVLVDAVLPEAAKPLGGRPQVMTDSELVTALGWSAVTVHQHTLKDTWRWLKRDQRRNFPDVPGYKGFVAHCHRSLPLLAGLLGTLLSNRAPFRFVDSTMLPVCKLARADRHKVAKGTAAFGKNHQGWHYGFKLHAAVDWEGRLAAAFFTPANESDLMQLPKLVSNCLLAVGDAGYEAKVMRKKLWKERSCFVLAPPRQKQMKNLLASWQRKLLDMRSKIEAVFDRLKQHLHLVTSFPRSVEGYFLHYLQVLVGYQLTAGGF